MHSEMTDQAVSQKEKDRHRRNHLYAESTVRQRACSQTETDSQKQRTELLVVSREGQWGRMDWEFGLSSCKLLHTEYITIRSYCI